MSVESKQQQHENVKQDSETKEQQQQQPQQPREQHHHHMHCTYEKDIVCDDNQLHQHQHRHHHQHQHQHQQIPQQQQQQQQKRQQTLNHDEQSNVHCTAEYSLPFQQQQQQEQQQHVVAEHHHQQVQHRHSHSHSPHPSRHTSPHSRHNSPHSRRTSPHSRHVSPHSRHVSPHSRHTSPHSRHTSPHSRRTSPHSRHNSPHGRHTSPHFGHTHQHMHNSHQHTGTAVIVDPLTRNLPHRASVRSTTSHRHSHQHHTHQHRRRRPHNSLQHSPPADQLLSHDHNCSNTSVHEDKCMQRHRSSIDVSNTSINMHCNDPQCVNNRNRQNEMLASKVSGCCSSRTELAQYFAEDLYGTTTRRPSSCCTSSDYCYQTDSTSLYGSRSSLSRNNSIKSAMVTMRQKKYNKRQSSYTSLGGALSASRPSSNMGSLSSVFDRAEGRCAAERTTSKDNVDELPDYACSPSPIRWSFLADAKSPTDSLKGKTVSTTVPAISNGYQNKEIKENFAETVTEYRDKTATVISTRTHRTSKTRNRGEETPSTSRKCCNISPKPCEESTTVQFHQEGEPYNNCCSNYIQCNTYLDQDLQITSEDIHQYLSKGTQKSGNILNNAKTYPFQPSNALEFQYKNNFANNNQTTTNTLSSVEGAESMRSYDSRYRRNSSKETNLNQNNGITETCIGGTCAASSCSSGTPLSPTNINLSSSTNNINIVFSSCVERNANEVKFINTGRTTEQSQHMTESAYIPFTYPAYDYTNMSATSIFEKPLGIDELPKEFCNTTQIGGNTSSSQHSSSLQSPEPNRASFESFDASSNHNLLSRHGSCHYSSTPRTPRSPNSPANSSTYSTTVNPVASLCSSHVHYDYPTTARQQQQQQLHTTFDINGQEQTATSSYHGHRHHYHHHHHHHQSHNSESFKLSNAFRKVRKRARKYTDFLRKK